MSKYDSDWEYVNDVLRLVYQMVFYFLLSVYVCLLLSLFLSLSSNVVLLFFSLRMIQFLDHLTYVNSLLFLRVDRV